MRITDIVTTASDTDELILKRGNDFFSIPISVLREATAPAHVSVTAPKSSVEVAKDATEEIMKAEAPEAGTYIAVATLRSRTHNTSAYGVASLYKGGVLVANSETETGFGEDVRTSVVLYEVLSLTKGQEVGVRLTANGDKITAYSDDDGRSVVSLVRIS
ncbi:hypothetical protein F862_gp025 [Vibrio phage vB_VpaS_MAR10]|uniref:Uncharacterized protein n=1 Tax=Vibrio phage vB_VpaS_MAR10 TaxID=1229755 RepID=K7RFH0_9CAUD|nr:hypothetical protein F862_gp025 [Vibrio phage vB_VpaS_MAR10]AFV81257.1 hypothetical protein MAR10_025 [Vibrio phage vB_VpaS_MAR10]